MAQTKPSATKADVKPETTATATETIAKQPEATKAAEPTSEKLIELRATKKSHLIAARGFEPDSDGEAAELLEAYKIEQLIKAEIANIANVAKQAELQLKRSERIALNDAMLEAYKALVLFTSNPDDDVSSIEYNTLSDAFKAAREIVDNELLAKYSVPVKAATTTTGSIAGAKLSDTENTAMVAANHAAGMTDAQNRAALMAAGVPRSTAWHSVNNWLIANNLKK